MNRNDSTVLFLIAIQAMLAVIVVARPETLGLSPITVTWLSILNVGIGVGLNQLRKFGADHDG